MATLTFAITLLFLLGQCDSLKAISESSGIFLQPIVKKLKELILREYHENLHILLLVDTKAVAKSIEDYFNSDNDLKFLKILRLTGIRSHKKDQGKLMLITFLFR